MSANIEVWSEDSLTLTLIALIEVRCTAGKPFWFLVFLSQKMSTVCAANLDLPAAASPEVPEQKKPLKPCCACPETKKVRDAW